MTEAFNEEKITALTDALDHIDYWNANTPTLRRHKRTLLAMLRKLGGEWNGQI